MIFILKRNLGKVVGNLIIIIPLTKLLKLVKIYQGDDNSPNLDLDMVNGNIFLDLLGLSSESNL